MIGHPGRYVPRGCRRTRPRAAAKTPSQFRRSSPSSFSSSIPVAGAVDESFASRARSIQTPAVLCCCRLALVSVLSSFYFPRPPFFFPLHPTLSHGQPAHPPRPTIQSPPARSCSNFRRPRRETLGALQCPTIALDAYENPYSRARLCP
ncbi:hypothetical protein V8C42DRAFT_309050 [Trichoderma barbatum]